MGENANINRLDDAVDVFEEGWSADSTQQLVSFLGRHRLREDLEAVTEIIRVDISRRYSNGLPVELDDYFRQFPELSGSADHAALIAFEDYRSRCRHGLTKSQGRWASLPGVAQQVWFREIPSADRPGSSRDQDLETSFWEAGFSLSRQLGEGAFGKVFLAVQHELSDRYVVLKVVDQPLQEPQRLARLQHTNIVPIYSVHRVGPKSVLCMPYAGSVTLSDYFASEFPASSRSGQSLVATVRRRIHGTIEVERDSQDVESLHPEEGYGPSADDEAAMKPLERIQGLAHHELASWMFARLSAALAHSHARDVMHCDLKPANILIRNDGEPALLDFNLAQPLYGFDDGWVGGTLPYMPPEYLSSLIGQSLPRDVSADLYSLGIILFEFMTGRLPFPAPRSRASVDLELALQQRRGGICWNAEDVLPFGLRCVIQRCLAFDPRERYRSAEHLQRDLECELNHLPLKFTAEPSLVSRGTKWMKRHPRLSSAGALAVAALIVVSILATAAWRLNESNRHLSARSVRDVFRTKSDLALAGLMSANFDDPISQLDPVDECLEMYGVLSDANWQEGVRWTYLDYTSQQFVINRLTDLLLRSSSVLGRQGGRTETGEAGSIQDLLATRLELLRTKPFREIAPVTITRLSRRAGEHRTGSRMLPMLTLDHPIDLFGETLFQLNQTRSSEAFSLLHPALLKVIDPFSYWMALGRCQMETDQLHAAEISFSLAIQTLQNSPVGYHYRGMCRMRMRTREKAALAQSDFDTVIRLDSTMHDAYLSRGLVREFLGDAQGAIEDLNVAVQADVVGIRGLLIRSRLHRKLGNQLFSERDFRDALRRTPSALEDWVSRALARLPSDKQGALADLEMAQKIDPTSLPVLQNQAHLLSEHLGDNQQAIDCLSRLLDLYPSTEKALLGRAVLFARIGDRDGALRDLQTATENLPRWSPASLYQAGCVHAILYDSSPEEMSETARQESRRLAFQFLSRALQAQYGGELLASDPDLKALRGEPAFGSLVDTVRMGKSH